MIWAKIVSKFHQESVQKHKNVIEITCHLALNFRNKFKNNFNPNDRQQL
jgi:hypothetical protein